MRRWVIAYVFCAVAIFGCDVVWLSWSSGHLYRPFVGNMLIDGFRPVPAALFYLLYVLGVVTLAILPALRDNAWRDATLKGAVLGLVAYGTYDLTNQATLKEWSTVVTAADMAWGTFLTAAGATCGYFAASRLARPNL